MAIIRLANVSKCFHIQPDRPRSFQDLAFSLFQRSKRQPREEFWALKDVSFTVDAGETLGIIGSNGSGKSTCLKLLTKIIEPTAGSVEVKGRVSALLELGAGFHPELTGRENVYLNGSLLGVTRQDMARRFDDVVAFAELERFIDVPVKLYSSGMYVRLAFATAINVDPDILLVDEVLAVGDHSFQEKCLGRINELKARGVTIVFVSHGLDTVRSLCERTIWLQESRLQDDGITDGVVDRYLHYVHARDEAAAMAEREQGAAPEQLTAPPQGGVTDSVARSRARWGTREVEITAVRFLDGAGRDRLSLVTREPVTIVLRYQARQRIDNPVFGVAIHRDDGLHVSGTNTFLSDYQIPYIEGSGEVRYTLDELNLLEGNYYLSTAVHSADERHTYDYHNLLHPFRVHAGMCTQCRGVLHIPAHWDHRTGRKEETEG